MLKDCALVFPHLTGMHIACFVGNLLQLIFVIQTEHVKTVTTLPLRSKVLEQCDKRGDLWASEVRTHLHGCIDLVAAEAVYHSKCFSRFMLNKESQQVSAGNDNKVQGRPEDHNMLQWFDMLCQWLESEAGAETYMLTELQNKMKEFSVTLKFTLLRD